MGSQVVADVHLNQYFRSLVEISTLVEIMSNIPSQCSCVSMPFTDHCELSVVCVVFVDLFIVFNQYGLAMSQFIVQLKISVSMMSSSILKANEQLTLSVLVLKIETNNLSLSSRSCRQGCTCQYLCPMFLVIFKKDPSTPAPFRDYIMSWNECSAFPNINVGLQLILLVLN